MPKKTTREEHDFCSPSQLEKRWRCPGSVRMEQKMKKPPTETSNADATRGKAIHNVLNDLVMGTRQLDDLSKGLEVDGYTLKATDIDHAAWCYGQVMAEVEAIPERHVVKCEFKVSLDELGISGGIHSNRTDVAIVVPGFYAIVIDYKMGGMWVTPPKWNWQFKAYAYGVWRQFGGTTVKAIKLQPYLGDEGEYMEYAYTAEELERAGTDIKAIVDGTKAKDAPLMRGKHCQYCTAKGVCPHFRGTLLSIPQEEHVATYLSHIDPQQARELYLNLQAAAEWVGNAMAACQGYGLEHPNSVTGYVEGHKNTKRKWMDDTLPKLVVLAKAHGVNIEDLQSTALLTPAKMEKLFPKKAKEEIVALQFKPDGDAILVEDPDYVVPQVLQNTEEGGDEMLLV